MKTDDSIKESLKALAKAEKHRQKIDAFARSKYNEMFINLKPDSFQFHYYRGFEVISKTRLRINYEYGGTAEMSYSNYFEVEI